MTNAHPMFQTLYRTIRALYSLLQDLAFCGLGEAKVHHLIHEFIHSHKVVPDALLLQYLEILRENLGNAGET